MKRGRRAFLASALLLVAILGGAALVFRKPIREQWLIWKLEHGSSEEADGASSELAAMGSLRAIEPLADRLALHTATRRPTWSRKTIDGMVKGLVGDDGHTATVVLGALYAIARMQREASLPYFESALKKDLEEIWKDALRQIIRVARKEEETVDFSFPEDVFTHDTYYRIETSPPSGGPDPGLRTPRAGE